jgi:hypothetical protein
LLHHSRNLPPKTNELLAPTCFGTIAVAFIKFGARNPENLKAEFSLPVILF